MPLASFSPLVSFLTPYLVSLPLSFVASGDNILAKVRMGSYQGLRHQMCLPVHGQRTHTNAKTQRKLGVRRAQMFNIPLLSKKAKVAAIAGGVPASGKPPI